MTVGPIVRFPDRRLAIPARPVTAFDGALRELARDLLETMRAAPGIGIAAPHIDIPLRANPHFSDLANTAGFRRVVRTADPRPCRAPLRSGSRGLSDDQFRPI